MNGLMTRNDFIEYATHKGGQAAADLLLLCGPDGFDGDWYEYNELMNYLKTL